MLWGERILSAINSARPSRKEMNLDPYLTPYTNVNSTSIMDLNGKGKTTLKKKKENIGEYLCALKADRFLRTQE